MRAATPNAPRSNGVMVRSIAHTLPHLVLVWSLSSPADDRALLTAWLNRADEGT